MDTNLTVGEKFRLKFHYLMCGVCERYAEQLDFISENVKKKRSQRKEEEDDKMNPDAKDRLKQALNSELKP